MRVDKVFKSVCLAIVLLFGLVNVTGCAYVTRVSVTSTGLEANGSSAVVALSADGRFAAYQSLASNLVSNDNNLTSDVFVRDNQTGTVELISRTASGAAGNGFSGTADITPDGQYVVFHSTASDLVAGDTNGVADVFIYDRFTSTMERVSVDSAGSQGSGNSLNASVSSNGRIVVFESRSAFSASDTNGTPDIYKRDRMLATTTLISSISGSMALGEARNPKMTQDGSVIAFQSPNNGFTTVDSGTHRKIYVADQQFGAHFNLTPGANDDSTLGSVERSSNSLQAWIAFESDADNLVEGDNEGFRDIFLTHIEVVGVTPFVTTNRITAGANGDSMHPRLRADNLGRQPSVVFPTRATNLQQPGATPQDPDDGFDVYVYEEVPTAPIIAYRFRLLSQTSGGAAANNHSFRAALSGDGQAVAFESDATNFGPADTNNTADVYLRQMPQPTIESVVGTLTRGQSSLITLSGEFPADDWEVMVGGDGVLFAEVVNEFSGSVDITVTLDASATLGARNIVLFKSASHLGIEPPFGAADIASVEVIP